MENQQPVQPTLGDVTKENGIYELKCYDIKRTSQLLQYLDRDRKAGAFTDLTVIVQGKHFRVHRVVMASLSEYFKAGLAFEGKDTKELTIDDLHPDHFSTVLDFAYTGSVTLSDDNVQDITIAAHYFNIPYLLQECQNFMIFGLDNDNVCQALQFSFSYSLTPLRQASAKFIAGDLDHISKLKNFAELEPDVLISLFSDDDLVVKKENVTLNSSEREEAVLRAVLKYQSLKRLTDPEVFDELLKTVRLPQMLKGRVKEIAGEYELVSGSRVVNKFILLNSKFHIHSGNKPDSKLDGLPVLWKNRRKFAGFKFIHRRRYALPSFSQRFYPDGFEINDPELEIDSIAIWFRPEFGGSPPVIGGIAVRYRKGTEESTDAYIRGQFLLGWESFMVKLNFEEYITEVGIYIEDEDVTVIRGIEFVTSAGRKCGPFGQRTGQRHMEYAPPSPKSYLYTICCDSDVVAGAATICNLVLKWIAF